MEGIKTYTYVCICISEYVRFIRKTEGDSFKKNNNNNKIYPLNKQFS